MTTQRNIRTSLAFAVILLSLATASFAATSPLPYNYRVIDGRLHAGGHPMNPETNYGNSDEQTMDILRYLRVQGVSTVIDLDNSSKIAKRYAELLRSAGIEHLYVPMSWHNVPSKEEWAKIKGVLRGTVYVHCKWGADRTGAVIAKYLIEEKWYSVKQALDTVSSGGSHAGVMGGMKVIYRYNPIYSRFWERKD